MVGKLINSGSVSSEECRPLVGRGVIGGVGSVVSILHDSGDNFFRVFFVFYTLRDVLPYALNGPLVLMCFR